MHLCLFPTLSVSGRRENQQHLPSQASASVLTLAAVLCLAHLCSGIGETDADSVGSFGEVRKLHTWINFFLPQGEAELASFCPFTLCLVGTWGEKSMVSTSPSNHLHFCLDG